LALAHTQRHLVPDNSRTKHNRRIRSDPFTLPDIKADQHFLAIFCQKPITRPKRIHPQITHRRGNTGA